MPVSPRRQQGMMNMVTWKFTNIFMITSLLKSCSRASTGTFPIVKILCTHINNTQNFSLPNQFICCPLSHVKNNDCNWSDANLWPKGPDHFHLWAFRTCSHLFLITHWPFMTNQTDHLLIIKSSHLTVLWIRHVSVLMAFSILHSSFAKLVKVADHNICNH